MTHYEFKTQLRVKDAASIIITYLKEHIKQEKYFEYANDQQIAIICGEILNHPSCCTHLVVIIDNTALDTTITLNLSTNRENEDVEHIILEIVDILKQYENFILRSETISSPYEIIYFINHNRHELYEQVDEFINEQNIKVIYKWEYNSIDEDDLMKTVYMMFITYTIEG